VVQPNPQKHVVDEAKEVFTAFEDAERLFAAFFIEKRLRCVIRALIAVPGNRRPQMMDEVVVLPQNQNIEETTGINSRIFPSIALFEGAMGQIVEKQTEREADHQRRRKPVIQNIADEAVVNRNADDGEQKQATEEPFEEFVVSPEFPFEEENFVIEESGRNHPKRSACRNKMIRVVVRIVDVGVVLHMDSRKDWERKAEHQRATMSEDGVCQLVFMGDVVRGIVNDGSRHVQGRHVHEEATPVGKVPNPVTQD